MPVQPQDTVQCVGMFLCLSCNSGKGCITYDSQDRGGVFIVATPRGVVEFCPTANGLQYVDFNTNPEADVLLVNASSPDHQDIPTQDHSVNVNTVCQNFEGFTKKQVKNAQRACRLMGMVASPSERKFQALIRLNMLKDCPVTNDDILNAHTIFGPDLASIRGKTVRRKPTHVPTTYVNVPWNLILLNQ